jgi:chorismate-pyruvate lyase
MTELTPPAVELQNLISLFYRDADLLGKFEERDATDCPSAYQQMLAHEAHMTVTVERRHGCKVDVEVLETADEPGHYLRKILLRRQSDRRVVQFGIVRLALEPLDTEVREEILSQQIPLGRVLIEHGVMRQVQLNALWQVACGADLAGYFDVPPGHRTFGRTALIFCNGEPAVELLEIVAPEDSFDP